MRFHSYIKVCRCCLLSHANGECCDSQHVCEPLSAIPDDLSPALGGEELGFSWQSCDGCDSPLGGDRFSMALFYNEENPPKVHADYPHWPGTLYDCPLCESKCYCEPETTKCVYCSIQEENV